MKVLVFAHRLEVGGTQVNAIDLAEGLRDLHGHDVVLFATPGPMTSVIRQKGLRFIAAPDARLHPSPARMRALRDAVRVERPDIIHAWDWWQCLEAYYGVHLPMGVPLIVSDMMMSLTRILPKKLWTTFGAPEVVEQARLSGRAKLGTILPPVDIRLNAPGAVAGQDFRDKCGCGPQDLLVVTVSRLAASMKGDSLVATINAVRALGREFPLKFVIVGEGGMRPQLEELAAQANVALGRDAVQCIGAVLDPREAYAAADIVVGMGGSALRGLAFGKPVLVVGEQGFSAPFDADTIESFYFTGMYGRGPADPGDRRFTEHLRSLASSKSRRDANGRLARQFVTERFSLEAMCARLSELCTIAAADKPGKWEQAVDAARTAAIYLRERRFLTPSRDRRPVDTVQAAPAIPLPQPHGLDGRQRL
jgi:glycosyltransferase involved in cell wall biosynthesis